MKPWITGPAALLLAASLLLTGAPAEARHRRHPHRPFAYIYAAPRARYYRTRVRYYSTPPVTYYYAPAPVYYDYGPSYWRRRHRWRRERVAGYREHYAGPGWYHVRRRHWHRDWDRPGWWGEGWR
jgi:hypothetical protein